MNPDHETRMKDGTKLILGAIALGLALTLLMAFLQDHKKAESWWQQEVVRYQIRYL